MPINNHSIAPKVIVEKGQKIYQDKLQKKLEPKYKGKFVAIEVESGDYFLGDTATEALEEAMKKYPQKTVHLIRIGYKGLYDGGWTKSNNIYGGIF